MVYNNNTEDCVVPADAATIGFTYDDNWTLEDGLWVRRGPSEKQRCAHEALEESLPPSQRGGAHNLVCTCPKCSIHC